MATTKRQKLIDELLANADQDFYEELEVNGTDKYSDKELEVFLDVAKTRRRDSLGMIFCYVCETDLDPDRTDDQKVTQKRDRKRVHVCNMCLDNEPERFFVEYCIVCGHGADGVSAFCSEACMNQHRENSLTIKEG